MLTDAYCLYAVSDAPKTHLYIKNTALKQLYVLNLTKTERNRQRQIQIHILFTVNASYLTKYATKAMYVGILVTCINTLY